MDVLRVRDGVAAGQKQCFCEVAAEWETVRWQRRAFRERGLEGGDMEEQRMQVEWRLRVEAWGCACECV
jgi:hypothetical protein